MQEPNENPIIDQMMQKFGILFSFQTFQGRLRLLFLVLSLAFVAMLAVIFVRNRRIQVLNQQLATLSAPTAAASNKILQQLERVTNAQQLYLMTQEDNFRTERQLIWKNNIEMAQQQLLALKDSIPSKSMKIQIDSIYKGLNEYKILQDDIEQSFLVSLHAVESLVDTNATDSLHFQKLEAKAQLQKEVQKLLLVRLYPKHAEVERLLLALIAQSENLLQKQTHLITQNLLGGRAVVMFIIVLMFVLILILLSYNLKAIQRSIIPPTALLSQLAKGKITEKITESKDELIGITQASNQLQQNLEQASTFAQKIGEGNFNYTYQPASREDILGNALLQMRNKLLAISQEDKKRNWTNEGLALFATILRSRTESLNILADELLAKLIAYIGAVQGGIFILNEENHQDIHLELIAAFAYNRKKFLQKKVAIGEGLLGQTFLEKESIYLENVPPEYLQVSSGLGETRPSALLITPLKLEETVVGIIEIASLEGFESYKIDFVEKVAENTASTLINLKVAERTKMLLQASTQQAEMLQAQEEELRQNNEELAATQEEMKSKQIELEKLKDNLQTQVQRQQATLQEIIDKETMLKALINNTEDHIISIDKNYNLVTFNEAFAKSYLSRNITLQKGQNLLQLLDVKYRAKMQEYYDRALKGEQFTTEIRYPLRDINLFFENSFNPIRNLAGEITGVTIFSRNISERKLQEEDRQKFVALIESSQDFILMASLDEKVIFINEAGKKLVGIKNQPIHELQITDFFMEEDRNTLVTSVIPMLMEKDSLQRETHLRNFETNQPIDVLETFLLVKNQETNAPICFALISRDIREQKIREEEISKKNRKLRESETRFKHITENAPGIIYQMETNLKTGELKFIFVSHYVEDILGYSPDEFRQIDDKRIVEIIHKEDFSSFQKKYAIALETIGKFRWEGRMLAKNGEYKWINAQSSARRLGDKSLMFDGIFTDITAQKIREEEIRQKNLQIAASEEELRQNLEELYAAQEHLQLQQEETTQREARLDAFINNTKDFIFSIDANYIVLIANEAFKEFASQRNRILKVNETMLTELMSEEDWQKYKPLYDRALKGEIFIEDYQIREGIFWEYAFNPVKNENGEILAISVIIRDISSRKALEITTQQQLLQIRQNEKVMRENLESLMEAQAEMEKQQKLMDGLINSTQDIIIILNPELKLLLANSSAYTHYPQLAQKQDRPIYEILNGQSEQVGFCQRALQGEYIYHQHQLKIHDEIQFFETNYFPIQRQDGSIVGVCAISRDVTKQVRKEEELQDKNQQLIATEEELRQNIEEMQTIQEEIQRQQSLTSGLLNSSDDNVLIVNPTFEVLLMNDTYVKEMAEAGKKITENFRGTLQEVTTEDVYPILKEAYIRALEGESFNQEIKTTNAKGKKSYYLVHFFPLYNNTEKVIGACSIARDITERYEHEHLIQAKNLELAQAEQTLRNNIEELQGLQWQLEQEKIQGKKELIRLQIMLDNMPFALALMNDKTQIIWVNQQFYDLTGTRQGFWEDKNLSTYFAPLNQNWQEKEHTTEIVRLTLPYKKNKIIQVRLHIKINAINPKTYLVVAENFVNAFTSPN